MGLRFVSDIGSKNENKLIGLPGAVVSIEVGLPFWFKVVKIVETVVITAKAAAIPPEKKLVTPTVAAAAAATVAAVVAAVATEPTCAGGSGLLFVFGLSLFLSLSFSSLPVLKLDILSFLLSCLSTAVTNSL